MKAWDARYRDARLVVVGVHTPEFGFEKDAGNVAAAIRAERPPLSGRAGQRLRHLERLGNQYWPAKYLIDARGQVRYTHFGEGDYGKTERRSARCSRRRAARRSGTRARRARAALGPAADARDLPRLRASDGAAGGPSPGDAHYRAFRGRLPLNHLALGGRGTSGRRPPPPSGAMLRL